MHAHSAQGGLRVREEERVCKHWYHGTHTRSHVSSAHAQPRQQRGANPTHVDAQLLEEELGAEEDMWP